MYGQEWNALRKRLKTLGGSTTAVSLLNLRQDAGFLATTAGSLPFVATHPDVFLDLPLTFDSLHKTVDQIVTVPFLRNFIDTMCIFCGFPAKGAMTAHMLYILERFFEESACYSVPVGGTCEMGNTLVRGLEKFGGKIQLNAHVDEILVENGRATGVRLKNGNVVTAKKAVVSNATPFDTVKMLGKCLSMISRSALLSISLSLCVCVCVYCPLSWSYPCALLWFCCVVTRFVGCRFQKPWKQ